MGCFVFLCVIMHIIHYACSALQLEYRVSKEEIYFRGSLNGTHYKTSPTYTYISPCFKALKALTFSFRPFRHILPNCMPSFSNHLSLRCFG